MKKMTIIAYCAFILIMVLDILFFRSLYFKQVEYSNKLLDRQVRIVGSDVDNMNMFIISDLTEIDFAEDISGFFSDTEIAERTREKIKLYYSKYEDIIVSVMFYNNAGDVYTLFKDEEKNTWLDASYRAQTQPEIITREILVADRDRHKYYLPVLKEGQVLGNFVITVDFDRYFSRLFAKYHLEQYQWQWILNDTGAVVFDNHSAAKYSNTEKIVSQIHDGVSGRLAHEIEQDGKSKSIISSFYPVSLFGKEFGLIFSAPIEFFQTYIIRNSLILGFSTLLIVWFIISLFRRHHYDQKKEMVEALDSESTLVTIIDHMPVGVVVYNQSREIVRANSHAATLFGYNREGDMIGKLVPDLTRNEYVSDLTGQFGQGKIIKLGNTSGERIVFRNSIPISFKGENATLEVFIDVTTLESARKQEAEANIAKSELLARMSYEIRTPLNGIIGMTEMLNRSDLPDDTKELAMLLKRSADLLLNIINDIFDVSKVETGKMILDEIPFSLREEIAYCRNLVKRENPDSMVPIIAETDQSVPENLIGDPYRLRQVITNLLYHSLSSTQTGEIRLHCSVKEADANVITLEFTLTDTGKNYTRAEIKKIFGDYITGRAGRNEWAEELKLGPILARQLAELMGGSLEAVSPAGKDNTGQERGLKVTFTIKTHLNEKLSKSLDLENCREISDIRTLVITGSESRDDDFLNIIHRIGLSVSVTSFQKYTVTQINTDRLNNVNRYKLLIILDEPGSDGFEVAEALRAAKLTGEYIILMFTSRDPKGHYSRCVDLGIDHLLVKPFASEDLITVLSAFFPSLKTPGNSSSQRTKKAKPSVLVVDDNYLNRKVVGSLLKVLGIAGEYAEDGNEALEKYNAKKFDLVLMDLIMPVIDGFEAARMILGNDQNAIIIALSADNMPETKQKAEQVGMKELLAKPVTVDDLRRVIDRYL